MLQRFPMDSFSADVNVNICSLKKRTISLLARNFVHCELFIVYLNPAHPDAATALQPVGD